MSEDILLRATRALREVSAEPAPHAGFTRARILRSAEARSGAGRGSQLRWALAIAGMLAAGGAFARLARHWPEIQRALPGERAAELQDSRRAPELQRTERAAPKDPAQPSAAREPAREAARAAAPAERTAAAQAAEAVAHEDDLALFRRARRLHLARDPLALGAWDDYLRVAPHGRHGPEARFSRAECLIRAGRIAEARAELEPFARGDYRGFRQREAHALLASSVTALEHER